MAVEIERKFLVVSSDWKKGNPKCKRFCQGYFPVIPDTGVTLRVRTADEEAFLTIKGPANGCARTEYEYQIPLEDARDMLSGPASAAKLEKIRYFVPAEHGLVWEIDVYLGKNQGLMTAEIELPTEETNFIRPSWLGKEVTGIGRFYNSMLARRPWTEWTDDEKKG